MAKIRIENVDREFSEEEIRELFGFGSSIKLTNKTSQDSKVLKQEIQVEILASA
jgi:hypothetical protein